MSPIAITTVAVLVVASVAGMSWLFIRRARWAPHGLGLETREPSSPSELLEGLVGLLFIGTIVAAGVLGGRRVAALALGVQLGGTALVAIILAIARPATFGRRAAPGPLSEEDDVPVGDLDAYDLFVSYKSQDAAVAREVVDRLIASGLSVWFAEYEVLLLRDRFREAILRGIGRSPVALAITNDRYAASVHCRMEMEELLQRLGPSQVMEARLPPEDETHRTFPELAGSRQVESSSVDDILDFVRRETGWGIGPAPTTEGSRPRTVEGRAFGGTYVLDSSGWEVDERGGERLEGETIRGPVFHLAEGEHRLVGNIYSGPEVAPEARREGRTTDDRAMYDALIPYVRKHVGTLDAGVRGVHLLFHGGFSQMLVTYRLAGYWTRKYSVILERPGKAHPTEFVFTFGFFGPFREYCRHAHLMDRMVKTLRWA